MMKCLDNFCYVQTFNITAKILMVHVVHSHEVNIFIIHFSEKSMKKSDPTNFAYVVKNLRFHLLSK